MPKKGHRTASRQAQLQRRSRRNRGRTQVVDSTPDVDTTAPPAVSVEPGIEQPAASAPVAVAEHSGRTGRATRRARQRAEPDLSPLTTYPYLGAELRRIGMLTALIVVVLAVLTVFLR